MAKETKYFKLTGRFVAGTGKNKTGSLPFDTNIELKDIEVTYSIEDYVTIDLNTKEYTCGDDLEESNFPVNITLKNKSKDNEEIGTVVFYWSKSKSSETKINYSYTIGEDDVEPTQPQPSNPDVPNPPTGTEEEKRIAGLVNVVFTHGVNLGYNKTPKDVQDIIMNGLDFASKDKTAVAKYL